MIPLSKAFSLAYSILETLKEECNEISIAGSIRRQCQHVNDIEIICIPKNTIATNLFGEETGRVRSARFVAVAAQLGKWIKGDLMDGRYVQLQLASGIKLDLFMPVPDDYYRQFAIRTGSAMYVHHVLASAWSKLGWCGVKHVGLRRQRDCIEKKLPGGRTEWELVNKKGELPPVWKSEEEVFDWCKVPFIKPAYRHIQANISR